MNQRALLLILPVLLLICGALAWAWQGGQTPFSTPQLAATNDATGGEPRPLDQESPGHDTRPDTPEPAPLERTHTTEEGTGGGKEDGTGPNATDPRRAPDSTAGGGTTNPGATNPGTSPTGTGTTQPAQPRQLTAREREEEARRTTGRAALAEKLGRTPSAEQKNELAKSPEQEKWAEQWYAEGITPPEMTPTPVRGKIMSQESREGLSKATVGLISFFPLDGIAGGPLLPVITEFTTDDLGFFSGDIPASKLPPANYPPVAISIAYETHSIVAAMPIDTLFVGKQNELGIFWAPDTPLTLKADATQFSGDLRVVSTGELNPQRWHQAKRAAAFAYFPAFTVAKLDPQQGSTGPAKGFAQLIGTWDAKDAPYVSLLSGQQCLQTRRPTKAAVASSASAPGVLPEPFNMLVFENDALTPITGQVVNAEGAGIASAVVITTGDALSQSAVTDSAGWFIFDDPPEKTSGLRVTHDSYVEVIHSPVVPGDSNVSVTMALPRPRILMHVTDKLTQAPLTELSVKVIGLFPHGKNKGKAMPEAFKQLTSGDGHFVLEWEFSIKTITLEKLGYFPRSINDPVKAQQTAGGELAIELSPGRKLDVNPKNYTAVEDATRWFPDADPGVGIYTAWSHHWIEWQVDFGEELEPGEEGGSFDVVLGCTNHGIVDNEYQFKVDVYVDGVKKGELTIMADSLNERTARMSLGKLSGQHTIRLVWTNDKWIPDQLDANIRYASLKFLEQP